MWTIFLMEIYFLNVNDVSISDVSIGDNRCIIHLNIFV